MAGLQLNHLYKVYPNGVKAVSDFTMEIKDKEFIVFVGPSGCGKSTTLRMIAGLEEISAGELTIGDRVVNDVEPKDRDIAMVFQNYALYPHMTVYQNMAYSLKLHLTPDVKRDKEGNPILDEEGKEIPIMRHYTKKEIDDKVRAAAEILDITDYLDRKPAAMSGGQRQRVALGRAIVRNPKVFLLDEPLSNLDAKLRTAMRSEISKLHQKLQTTFIYVTHDQVEAMTMGTRIVVMKKGLVQQIDKPRNLYDYPVNKFVAGFIGTPQMNFFNGKLQREGDKINVVFEWQKGARQNEEGEIEQAEGVQAETKSFSLAADPELFLKTDKTYFNGKPVTFGLRSEHVSLDAKKYPCKGKCKVTFVEELGTECLVYADIDTEAEEIVVDSPTKIIIKTTAGATYKEGEIIDISYDLSHLHIFDAETENTISPRIPEKVYLDCEVKDNVFHVFGAEYSVPAYLGKIADGKYTVIVPTDAVVLNGDTKAEVYKTEDVEGNRLVYLKAGNEILFAVDNDTKLGKQVDFTIDVKRITVTDAEGNEIIKALPLENSLDARIIKYKKKVEVEREGKPAKVVNKKAYDLVIGEVHIPCDDKIASSIINGADTNVFAKDFILELKFSSYAAKLADSGITAKVVTVIDYGKEKFAKCLVGDSEVYVAVDGGVSEGQEIHFTLDCNDLAIIDKEVEVRLV